MMTRLISIISSQGGETKIDFVYIAIADPACILSHFLSNSNFQQKKDSITLSFWTVTLIYMMVLYIFMPFHNPSSKINLNHNLIVNVFFLQVLFLDMDSTYTTLS